MHRQINLHRELELSEHLRISVCILGMLSIRIFAVIFFISVLLQTTFARPKSTLQSLYKSMKFLYCLQINIFGALLHREKGKSVAV